MNFSVSPTENSSCRWYCVVLVLNAYSHCVSSGLLRQYLKLGGRVVGFNIDPDFGHSIDCLTVVDLSRTPDEVLGKYMSPEALARFRAATRPG